MGASASGRESVVTRRVTEESRVGRPYRLEGPVETTEGGS